MPKKYVYTKKTGSPRKYSNVEDFQKKIDEYFKSCFSPARNKLGDIVKDSMGKEIMEQIRPFTMSGLANALGLSRVGLFKYAGRPEFVNSITRAKRIIETYVEERLFDKDGCKGAIFSLINNFESWKDKSETEHSIAESTIDKFNSLSAQELLSKANALIGKTSPK